MEFAARASESAADEEGASSQFTRKRAASVPARPRSRHAPVDISPSPGSKLRTRREAVNLRQWGLGSRDKGEEPWRVQVMPLRVAFDLDGTIADMEGALQREAEQLFGPNVQLRPAGSDHMEPPAHVQDVADDATTVVSRTERKGLSGRPQRPRGRRPTGAAGPRRRRRGRSNQGRVADGTESSQRAAAASTLGTRG